MDGFASALLMTLAILRVPVPTPAVPGSPCRAVSRDLTYLLEDAGRRVRALTPRLSKVLEAGARRSPSFLRLLRILEDTDVIVQIVEEPNLRQSTPAQLAIVPVPGDVRFLRVQVGNRRGGDDLVALLGHELFHALEIANEPQVRDPATLHALYRRIGFGTDRDLQFDTHEANVMERRILRELGKDDGCRLLSRAMR